MGAFKIKYGVCVHCEKKGDFNDKPLARKNPPECQYHYKLEKAKIYQKRAEERERDEPKKKKPIKNISSKLLSRLAIYRVRRDEYLSKNKICEVEGCGKRSTNVHHKAGREGILLILTKYFMACCETCHPNRIHFNPDYEGWAREKGYIITVNAKDEIDEE